MPRRQSPYEVLTDEHHERFTATLRGRAVGKLALARTRATFFNDLADGREAHDPFTHLFDEVLRLSVATDGAGRRDLTDAIIGADRATYGIGVPTADNGTTREPAAGNEARGGYI